MTNAGGDVFIFQAEIPAIAKRTQMTGSNPSRSPLHHIHSGFFNSAFYGVFPFHLRYAELSQIVTLICIFELD